MAFGSEAPRRTNEASALSFEACEHEEGRPGEVVLRLGRGNEEVVAELRHIRGILEEMAVELKALREGGDHEVKPVYSVKEAGQLLGRSEQTVRRWIREGQLDSEKAGESQQARHIIPHASVAQYLG
jgi:excisionase family DNA binding protein